MYFEIGPLGYVGRDHLTNMDEKSEATAVRLLTGVGTVRYIYRYD